MLLIVTPLMMALGGTVRSNPRRLAEDIARQVGLNPAIIATVLASSRSPSALRLPGPIEGTLSFVGNAAAPGALFLLGLSLAQRSFAPLALETPIVIGVKLIVHPLIVYLLLSWVGGFDAVWVNTAILIAALPPAANVIALAGRYKVYGDRAAGCRAARLARCSGHADLHGDRADGPAATRGSVPLGDGHALAHRETPQRRDAVDQKQPKPPHRRNWQEIRQQRPVHSIDRGGACHHVDAPGTIVGIKMLGVAWIGKRTGEDIAQRRDVAVSRG